MNIRVRIDTDSEVMPSDRFPSFNTGRHLDA